ncbi:hypothetical protein Tco_1329742 [Tanacetum coccineum]
MHFLLSTMNVVYVLTIPISDDGDDATLEQIRKRSMWENYDYVCRGLILNGMSDSLFDIYQNIKSGKELWDSFEARYMAEDASSENFLDSDYPKGNNVAGPSVVNMIEHNNSIRLNIVNDIVNSAFISTSKLNDSIMWHARLVHDEALDKFKVFQNKVELQQGSLIKRFRTDRGAFQGFRFYVIEPNESVSINSIIESKDAIFDENIFSSVLRPSQRSLINRTEDIGGSVVPEEVMV